MENPNKGPRLLNQVPILGKILAQHLYKAIFCMFLRPRDCYKLYVYIWGFPKIGDPNI